MLSNFTYQDVVNGALSGIAARACCYESFGNVNTFLYFNFQKRTTGELWLAVDVPGGFYEALVNYTAPHQE